MEGGELPSSFTFLIEPVFIQLVNLAPKSAKLRKRVGEGVENNLSYFLSSPFTRFCV